MKSDSFDIGFVLIAAGSFDCRLGTGTRYAPALYQALEASPVYLAALSAFWEAAKDVPVDVFAGIVLTWLRAEQPPGYPERVGDGP